jgi:hypothetical protein
MNDHVHLIGLFNASMANRSNAWLSPGERKLEHKKAIGAWFVPAIKKNSLTLSPDDENLY